MPEGSKNKKLHFLERRLEVMNDLSALGRRGRISFMKDKLQVAVSLVGQYVRDHGSPFKTDHLQRWIAVLDTAGDWEHMTEEDETVLDDLLNELDT